MARAINPNKIIEYVLEDDRELPPEQQTTFLLKPLTMETLQKIERQVTSFSKKSNEATFSSTKMHLDALRHGLVGWRNFPDEDGNALEFQARGGLYEGQPTEEALHQIRHQDRMEMGAVLLAQSHVSTEEGKP